MEKVKKVIRSPAVYFAVFSFIFFFACSFAEPEPLLGPAYRPAYPQKDAKEIKVLLINYGQKDVYYSYSPAEVPEEREILGEKQTPSDYSAYSFKKSAKFSLPKARKQIDLYPFSNNLIFSIHYRFDKETIFLPENRSFPEPFFSEHLKYRDHFRLINQNSFKSIPRQFLKIHAPEISLTNSKFYFWVYADFANLEKDRQTYFRIISVVSRLMQEEQKADPDFIRRGINHAEQQLLRRIFRL